MTATRQPPTTVPTTGGAPARLVVLAGPNLTSGRGGRYPPRTDVEWERVNEHRTHWPFLRDRRIDAYGGLEQRLLD